MDTASIDVPPDADRLVAEVTGWYAHHARELPWRGHGATPWGVLVSEVMLQQTPVARVLPVWAEWLERWPTPTGLAAAGAGEAVRAWGRLGYPRRSIRLYETAVQLVERHRGEVPDEYDALRALPGIGDYTAAAVASFAFRQRHPVLDTNVRRVLTRVATGDEHPSPTVTRAEREIARQLLPADGADSALWSVAVMELGALVCTAASPRCADCPVAAWCRWNTNGRPAYSGPPRRTQQYGGTDRQCRGRLLGVVRDRPGAVHLTELEGAWSGAEQRGRCLDSLVADGLLVRRPGGWYALPGP